MKKKSCAALLPILMCASIFQAQAQAQTQAQAQAQDSFSESDRVAESPFTIPAPVQSNPLYFGQPQAFSQSNQYQNQLLQPPQVGSPQFSQGQQTSQSGNGYTLSYPQSSGASSSFTAVPWSLGGYSPWSYSGYSPWSFSHYSPWSYSSYSRWSPWSYARPSFGYGFGVGGVGGAIGLGLGLGLGLTGLLPHVTSYSGPYSSIYSSSCYGPYSYANRYWQFSGHANSGGHSLLGPMSGGGFVRTAPSKASGNYYAPATADPSASGSYYADSGNNYRYLPKSQSFNNSNLNQNQNQYYKPQKNYWGGSSPFPTDLNSTPWPK